MTGYEESTLRPCLGAILLYAHQKFPERFVRTTGFDRDGAAKFLAPGGSCCWGRAGV